MALYLFKSPNRALVIRARNGHVAGDLVSGNGEEYAIKRIQESGPPEIIFQTLPVEPIGPRGSSRRPPDAKDQSTETDSGPE